jgi:HEPN domain-containing protein
VGLLDVDEFERWRNQATETRAATDAMRAAGSWAWCCFLAEQAAQLGVKGLLRAIGQPNEAWGHDLVTLVARASSAVGESFTAAAVADAAARLGRHYIPTRYPDAHAMGTPADHYREADADAALADLETIEHAVDAAWTALQTEESEAS